MRSEMVNRFQPRGGMVSASNGEYVEFMVYDELLAQYQSLYETARSYVEQVARGEITADQAKAGLLAVRRLAGL